MSELVLCRDCRHAVPESKWLYWQCGREAVVSPNLVTGEPQAIGRYRLCSIERTGTRDDQCGEEGRFFEPRKEAS